MAIWHRTLAGDLALRVSGAILLGLAWQAIESLARIDGAGAHSPVAFALAAAGFFAGSAGSACIALGRHLFDEVEISERWRRQR